MEEILSVRVPSALQNALERQRKRMSKAVGAEVKKSAVVRAILEQALKPKRRSVSSERAA